MKQCRKCKLQKSKIEFSPNRSKKDGLQDYCRLCMREANLRSYRKNRDKFFLRSKERDRQIDEIINKYKSNPCMDCGEKYPPYVMDFDHRGEKLMGIAKMRRRRMAIETIKKEIKKCDIVCANCHRIRTNKQNPARYSKEEDL